MLFPILGPSSLSVVMAQPDERHANRTASVLEWYDRHRAYSTTSGLNKEQEFLAFSLLFFFQNGNDPLELSSNSQANNIH